MRDASLHPSDSLTCDVVVIGSGASGLAAAVTAAYLGLEVVVCEKDRQFGGTSAWSGGWMWVPRNPLARRVGIEEPVSAPRTYLEAELGESFDADRIDQFLTHAPKMVAFFETHTSVKFVDGNAIPDFHEATPASVKGGRSVCAAPFDGRALGRRISDLKPPLDAISPFGMGIASGADLRQFLFATRKLSACAHVARRVVRHGYDVLRHGRGMHLVNGNALVARLLKSADDLNVRLIANAPARKLRVRNGRVVGVDVGNDGAVMAIEARRGVVLATGGFPHDDALKAQLFPHAPTGREHHSAAPLTNTGDGIRLGAAAGGHLRRDLAHAGAWAPVSLVPNGDGTFERFPHLVERAKPGLIMVRRSGRRFTNEANSYHDVMQALFATTPAGEDVEAWLVCDATFRRRYGLGRVRPLPFPVRPWIANGYLKCGRTIPELARACGIDGQRLEATVKQHNLHAVLGDDPEFGRGSSQYNRVQGEAGGHANPCLAPIAQPPFYAVRIVPGSLGTFAGLKTDRSARVLRNDNTAVDGLFAVGNDMSSIMEGHYPSGGITLGPGMTFGYIAAHALANVPLDNNR